MLTACCRIGWHGLHAIVSDGSVNPLSTISCLPTSNGMLAIHSQVCLLPNQPCLHMVLSDEYGLSIVFGAETAVGRLNKTHSECRRVGYQVGRCEQTPKSVYSRRLFLCVDGRIMCRNEVGCTNEERNHGRTTLGLDDQVTRHRCAGRMACAGCKLR